MDQKAKRIIDDQTLVLQERYGKIINNIQALKDEKDELLRAPNTREDVKKIAKESLRFQRKYYAKMVLGAHFRDCQTGRSYPFDAPDFKVSIFGVDQCYKLAYFAITEKDIDEAASELENIGITDEERATRIKKIEQEILELGKQINEKL